MGSSNRYTEEYKKETAEYAIASGKSVNQVAKELGLCQTTLNKWVVKRQKESDGGTSRPSDTSEVRELKKRVAELEMENEFLKKASAFFAKNQR